ncbi:MAG: hypothetical protein OXM02_01680 [Bacteroidota bacterium]|nr:hypothetical protein [Bacteroidota bacterium]MDE2955753.1 hypothetical protein [Bacteroidota bacterium]
MPAVRNLNADKAATDAFISAARSFAEFGYLIGHLLCVGNLRYTVAHMHANETVWQLRAESLR